MDAFEIVLKKSFYNRYSYLEKQFDILIRCNAIANEYVAEYDEDDAIYKEYYGIGRKIRRLINRKIKRYRTDELVYMAAYTYSYSINQKKFDHHRESARELLGWVERWAIPARTGLEFVCGWTCGGSFEDLPEWCDINVPF